MVRQLTKRQIREKFVGQEEVVCYTVLARVSRGQPIIEKSEDMALSLLWYTSDPSGSGPAELGLLIPRDIDWAEGDGRDMNESGSLVVEDYSLRLYAEDGEGGLLDDYLKNARR